MQSRLTSTLPIFNRSRFHALTLNDKGLETSLLAVFFSEAESLRCSITAAARESARSFDEVVHRLRNVSHFVAGDRLTWLMFEIGRAYRLSREEDRIQAALLIVSEIDALEQALTVHGGACPDRSHGSARGAGMGGPQRDGTRV